MSEFMKLHADKVNGVLSGLDRVRLRGTLRWLSSVRGIMSYLSLVSWAWFTCGCKPGFPSRCTSA